MQIYVHTNIRILYNKNLFMSHKIAAISHKNHIHIFYCIQYLIYLKHFSHWRVKKAIKQENPYSGGHLPIYNPRNNKIRVRYHRVS